MPKLGLPGADRDDAFQFAEEPAATQVQSRNGLTSVYQAFNFCFDFMPLHLYFGSLRGDRHRPVILIVYPRGRGGVEFVEVQACVKSHELFALIRKIWVDWRRWLRCILRCGLDSLQDKTHMFRRQGFHPWYGIDLLDGFGGLCIDCC